jgi:hypothetical protein
MNNIRPPHILEKEDAYLKQAWLDCVPTEEIARYLDRPISYVASRAGRLGVKRPEWYRVMLSQRNGCKSYSNEPVPESICGAPVGYRMSEEAIAHLYAGRRYDSIDTDDNTTGRIHLPMTFVPRAA